MNLYTPSSPHMHSANSVTKVMLKVLIALVPGIAVYIALFGLSVLTNIVFAVVVALLCEVVMLKVRKRPVVPFITDGSAVVTGVLLALSIPPMAPWWLLLIGVSFAMVFAKHLYGGLGYNPFNPAMVGYAMLLISFPKEMSAWLAPKSLQETPLSLADQLTLPLSGSQAVFDAISSATPLDYMKTQLGLEQSVAEIVRGSTIFGEFAGTGYEWVAIGFLVGGLWLIHQKVISWHIPVSLLAGLFLMSAVFNVAEPTQYPSPVFHLLAGATILGAFFIATDPVSAATTPLGKLVYGFGIGVLIYVIRTWGGYPDAIAFAVLLMNMCAPMIDYYTRPKVFGHGQGK